MTNKEAIQNLKKLRSFHNGSYAPSIDFAIEALKEKPKGEWLKVKNRSKRSYQRFCSNCHHIAYFCGTGNYPFCPYCKAEMKSEEDTKK